MMNHITSSREEFLLLLNKWKAESTQVVIMHAFKDGAEARAILHVRGIVKRIEEHQDNFYIEGPEKNFAMVVFEGCTFRYTQPEMSIGFTEDQIDEAIALISPSGVVITVFAVQP